VNDPLQSAPGQLAGRCAGVRRIQDPQGEVSIRARPVGRAMPRRKWLPSCMRHGFNPRPASWPGDAHAHAHQAFSGLVSIRARPVGRAMRRWGCRAARRGRCFNPRPASWPGDAWRRRWLVVGWGCFNPRPASWPGDAHDRDDQRRCQGGFNPRPASWPGDAISNIIKPSSDAVSIRARPVGRAMRVVAMLGLGGGHVSIRARPVGRAMRLRPGPHRRPPGFQSAPGQLAGRCSDHPNRTTETTCFNPRPASWPGDARAPSRQGGDAGGFNPRPASWPGDAILNHARALGWLVSIRARPVGRAMPCVGAWSGWVGMFQSAPGQLAGRCHLAICGAPARLQFQSAPGQLAGRCVATFNANLGRMKFQSAPGQLAGRCDRKPAASRLHCGFNPRPASWPGDAWCEVGIGRGHHVSIRARPVGRAMRAFLAGLDLDVPVSIRARPVGRAMPGLHCTSVGRTRFQSAPGQLAGRCSWLRSLAVWSAWFQSAPGQLAGRCRPVRRR